ncbi:glycoprotein 3-alpha-L-fucosyltransferase A-like [Contarinia nasturtii]|uniref:glycoprotein 3-alpha-L-fucosyltransferase A-like n=1 Tax=Contarinia nasturtii TaxID=265458 RepID=UPI0012D3DCAF|nr:glycoprotein 3-alpha-L-fucosyltransferase A-like [Contarinia nasturtii]
MWNNITSFARCIRRNQYFKYLMMVVVIVCILYWIKKMYPVRPAPPTTHILKNMGYKSIFVYHLPEWFKVLKGIRTFQLENCAVQRCFITTSPSEREMADLVLFNGQHDHTRAEYQRNPQQIFALYYSESPPHSRVIPEYVTINWTISYRSDSTIPSPYRRWVYNDDTVWQKEQDRNYATNKTRQVAWFVSNCDDKNGRLEYVMELQKFISVDIYGKCGPLSCPREDALQCFRMLDEDYKFYLAFENSNCKDYITEKFFVNALSRRVLPIVMGPPRETYEKIAPYYSFIHVDDFKSPADLAAYLHELDEKDELYNAYFQWKGTGKIVKEPIRFFCTLCERLHDAAIMDIPHWYPDVNYWWRKPGTCSDNTWLHEIRTSASIRIQNHQYCLFITIILIVYNNVIKM